MRPRWPWPDRGSLLLLGAGLLVAAGLGEALLRWHPPRWLYFETRDVVQQDFSEPGPDASLPYVPRAGAEGRFRNREFDTRVRINSQRLRADREYSAYPPAGTVRIVAAGDSFVFGWGVEGHETSAALLERELLAGVEVLNLGVSGYTANEALERLRREGVAFHPGIVLFFVSRFPWVQRFPYLFLGDRLYLANTAPLTWWSRAGSAIRHASVLASFLYSVPDQLRVAAADGAGGAPVDPRAAPGSADVAAGLALLDELRALGRTSGFRPVVVLVPEAEDVEDVVRGHPPRRETSLLRSYCNSQFVDLVDLTPVLARSWQAGARPYFEWDDHWNARGHRVAAETLTAFLQKEAGLRAGRRAP